MQRALILACPAARCPRPGRARPQPPRIVNGAPADPGEYPSQGFCSSTPIPGRGGRVQLRRHAGRADEVPDRRALRGRRAQRGAAAGELQRLSRATTSVATLARRESLSSSRGSISTRTTPRTRAGTPTTSTMLTLDEPLAAAPRARVIKPGETSLWSPGDLGHDHRVGRRRPKVARTAPTICSRPSVPIRTDSVCSSQLRRVLRPRHDGLRRRRPTAVSSSDTCQGDSGGPLLVERRHRARDSRASSRLGTAATCRASPASTRASARPPLNAWVRGRLYDVDFTVTSRAAGQPRRPSAPPRPASTGFSLGLRRQRHDRRHGRLGQPHLPHRRHVRAGPAGDGSRGPAGRAAAHDRRRRATAACAAPAPAPPAGNGPAPQPGAVVQTQLATILALGQAEGPPRPVQDPRQLRADCAAGHRGDRGLPGQEEDRQRARRGPPRRLAPGDRQAHQGRQEAAPQSKSKRLKVRLQVRVKRQVLRSKTLTLRR